MLSRPSEPFKTLLTASAEETRAAGIAIAGLLPRTAVVSLEGELGAGKTTLTQGIAVGRGAASAEEVSSPTFALIHEYGEPVRVYHVDLYRLDTAEQAARLGLEELYEQPALTLLEWGERFPELLPQDRWLIRIAYLSTDERRIELFAPGSRPGDSPTQTP